MATVGQLTADKRALDPRTIVENEEAINNITQAYVGLIIYNKENGKLYKVTEINSLSGKVLNKVVLPPSSIGAQPEINSNNKLSADNIMDGNTNKVVTQTEKTTWNGKQDVLTTEQLSNIAKGGTALQPSSTSGLLKNDGTVDTETQSKAANAVPMPSNPSSDKVLGYENGAVAWVAKPSNGQDGEQGPQGEAGRNPCLGRLNAVPADFDTAFPDAIAGDYVYVDIYDSTTQITTTTIYHYIDDTNGWDRGTVIDAEHPTFASSQAVTSVHIKDLDGEDDTNAQGVLSAEAGSSLNRKIDSVIKDIDGIHLPEASIGQISSAGSWNLSETTSHYVIQITSGSTIRIVASSVYTRYTLLKSYPTQIVAGNAVDYATGYESGEGVFPYIQLAADADTGNIVAPSDANFLFVAKTIGSGGDDRTPSAIYIDGVDIIDGVAGLKESVNKNTTNITTLQESVGDIEEDVEELSGSVESAVQEVDGFADNIVSIEETLYGEQPHEYPPLDSNILVNAIISSNGIVNASSPRCGYYIPLLGGEHITGKASSGVLMYYCCVKSIVTAGGQPADLATGWSGMQTSTSGGSVEFTAPNDARYLYIGHIVDGDATHIKDPSELVINNWDVINQEYIGDDLDEGLVERVEDLEENTAFHGLLKITVAEHNEGMYHYGNQPYGISQADWDTAVASWKSLLTNTNSDFLSLVEHKPILNAAEDGVTDVNSYDELYKQFYPYRVDADTLSSTTFQIALYSKYPIKSYEKVYFPSPSTRYYNKFLVDVNGIEICFIIQKGYVGVPDSPEAAIRVAEFTQMVNDTANNPIVIIPIDTNGYSEDFDVFRNNGYQLGNFGYWGGKITSGISDIYPQGHTKFDNIIVKGLNINSFDVCDEHATSDHFPTMATLTKFFE